MELKEGPEVLQTGKPEALNHQLKWEAKQYSERTQHSQCEAWIHDGPKGKKEEPAPRREKKKHDVSNQIHLCNSVQSEMSHDMGN